MNLEFTFSVSSDIKWRVNCDLTENTPFIKTVYWGNTEIKDISPSILELIEEQAMYVSACMGKLKEINNYSERV